jgi:ACS family hexuronate transporter-like MFS transporter
MDPSLASSSKRLNAESKAASNYLPWRAGHFRWVICALLLFGITKNYMDRQLLGVLKTLLQRELR